MWGEMKTIILLCEPPAAQPGQRLVPVHLLERGHPVLFGVQQLQQAGGQGTLGAMEGHQIDGGNLGVTQRNGLADHSLISGGQFVEARNYCAISISPRMPSAWGPGWLPNSRR